MPIADIWTNDVRRYRQSQLEGNFDQQPCRSCTRWNVCYHGSPSRHFNGLTPLKVFRPVNRFLKPFGWIDCPIPHQTISGLLEVAGWALASGGKNIARVDIAVGNVRKQADYGFMRPDVTLSYPDRAGRWFPGFSCRFDSADFDPGKHLLEAIVTDDAGMTTSIGRIELSIEAPARVGERTSVGRGAIEGDRRSGTRLALNDLGEGQAAGFPASVRRMGVV